MSCRQLPDGAGLPDLRLSHGEPRVRVARNPAAYGPGRPDAPGSGHSPAAIPDVALVDGCRDPGSDTVLRTRCARFAEAALPSQRPWTVPQWPWGPGTTHAASGRLTRPRCEPLARGSRQDVRSMESLQTGYRSNQTSRRLVFVRRDGAGLGCRDVARRHMRASRRTGAYSSSCTPPPFNRPGQAAMRCMSFRLKCSREASDETMAPPTSDNRARSSLGILAWSSKTRMDSKRNPCR